MAVPSKEDLRARFWAIKRAVEAREADVAALREKLEPEWLALFDAYRAKRDESTAAIRAVEADVGLDGLSMVDAKQEMAFIARGLGGQVGQDPGA